MKMRWINIEVVNLEEWLYICKLYTDSGFSMASDFLDMYKSLDKDKVHIEDRIFVSGRLDFDDIICYDTEANEPNDTLYDNRDEITVKCDDIRGCNINDFVKEFITSRKLGLL